MNLNYQQTEPFEQETRQVHQKRRDKSAPDQPRKSQAQTRRSKSVHKSEKRISISAIKWNEQQIEVKIIKELSKPLLNKKIFVEIFSGPTSNAQNLSDCNNDCLAALGAKPVSKWNKNIDFIIWQYGSLHTLEKAQQERIPLVNPLWINECLMRNKVVPYQDFPIMKLSQSDISEIQKRDKLNPKKVKQSQGCKDDPQDSFDQKVGEFFRRNTINRFREQLAVVNWELPKFYTSASQAQQELQFQSQLLVDSLPKLGVIAELHDENVLNISQQMGSHAGSKTGALAGGQSSQRYTQLSQFLRGNQAKTVAFHKSCLGSIASDFEQIKASLQYLMCQFDQLELHRAERAAHETEG